MVGPTFTTLFCVSCFHDCTDFLHVQRPETRVKVQKRRRSANNVRPSSDMPLLSELRREGVYPHHPPTFFAGMRLRFKVSREGRTKSQSPF